MTELEIRGQWKSEMNVYRRGFLGLESVSIEKCEEVDRACLICLRML